MSAEDNKRVVLRFYEEVWDRGHVEVAREVFAEDYVRHDLRPARAIPGPDGQRRIAADFRRAFPDLRMSVDLILAEGDLVAARWTTTGTHTGPWGDVAPTGKAMSFSGVNVFRFEDGKVVEIWNHRDDLGLIQQLGVPVFAGPLLGPPSEARLPDRTVNGVRLSFEERGAGAPILLIHGTGGSVRGWGRALDDLAALGRVIAYDRRGCGQSERPTPYESTSVSEHADDAAALIDALDASPAVVIGRSYGGEIALDLALRHPDRVRALVLLEPALLHLSPEARSWEERLHERVRAAAAEGIERVGEAFIVEVLGEGGWEGLPRDVRASITRDGPVILAELGGGPLEVELDELGTIAAPTLLVAASGSPGPFRGVTDLMSAAMPGAETALVSGGHRVDPTDPAVVGFVRRVLGLA